MDFDDFFYRVQELIAKNANLNSIVIIIVYFLVLSALFSIPFIGPAIGFLILALTVVWLYKSLGL